MSFFYLSQQDDYKQSLKNEYARLSSLPPSFSSSSSSSFTFPSSNSSHSSTQRSSPDISHLNSNSKAQRRKRPLVSYNDDLTSVSDKEDDESALSLSSISSRSQTSDIAANATSFIVVSRFSIHKGSLNLVQKVMETICKQNKFMQNGMLIHIGPFWSCRLDTATQDDMNLLSSVIAMFHSDLISAFFRNNGNKFYIVTSKNDICDDSNRSWSQMLSSIFSFVQFIDYGESLSAVRLAESNLFVIPSGDTDFNSFQTAVEDCVANGANLVVCYLDLTLLGDEFIQYTNNFSGQFVFVNGWNETFSCSSNRLYYEIGSVLSSSGHRAVGDTTKYLRYHSLTSLDHQISNEIEIIHLEIGKTKWEFKSMDLCLNYLKQGLILADDIVTFYYNPSETRGKELESFQDQIMQICPSLSLNIRSHSKSINWEDSRNDQEDEEKGEEINDIMPGVEFKNSQVTDESGRQTGRIPQDYFVDNWKSLLVEQQIDICNLLMTSGIQLPSSPENAIRDDIISQLLKEQSKMDQMTPRTPLFVFVNSMRLSSFRKHSDRDFQIHSPFSVAKPLANVWYVKGGNGKGKSSFFMALQWALSYSVRWELLNDETSMAFGHRSDNSDSLPSPPEVTIELSTISPQSGDSVAEEKYTVTHASSCWHSIASTSTTSLNLPKILPLGFFFTSPSGTSTWIQQMSSNFGENLWPEIDCFIEFQLSQISTLVKFLEKKIKIEADHIKTLEQQLQNYVATQLAAVKSVATAEGKLSAHAEKSQSFASYNAAKVQQEMKQLKSSTSLLPLGDQLRTSMKASEKKVSQFDKLLREIQTNFSLLIHSDECTCEFGRKEVTSRRQTLKRLLSDAKLDLSHFTEANLNEVQGNIMALRSSASVDMERIKTALKSESVQEDQIRFDRYAALFSRQNAIECEHSLAKYQEEKKRSDDRVNSHQITIDAAKQKLRQLKSFFVTLKSQTTLAIARKPVLDILCQFTNKFLSSYFPASKLQVTPTFTSSSFKLYVKVGNVGGLSVQLCSQGEQTMICLSLGLAYRRMCIHVLKFNMNVLIFDETLSALEGPNESNALSLISDEANFHFDYFDENVIGNKNKNKAVPTAPLNVYITSHQRNAHSSLNAAFPGMVELVQL